MALDLVQRAASNPFSTFFLLTALYVLGTRLYNVWFHPCAKYPGPWTRAAFHFPFYWEQFNGSSPYNIHKFHQKYGPVVRIAPDRLSFIRSPAWKDIYGFRKDRSQVPKDYKRYPMGAEDYLPLFASNDKDHTRLRRLVAHAFSETALREQYPLVQGHIDGFFKKIRDTSGDIDMDEWLDRLSFDILSDLTFGETFGSVEKGVSDKFISDCYVGCNITPALQMMWDYKIVEWFFKAMFQVPSIKMAQEGSEEVNRVKVKKRMDAGAESRKDFMTYILRYNEGDERGASIREIRGLTNGLMAAGGEEPSSFMSAAIWYMLKSPTILRKAQNEIREVYSSADSIHPETFDKIPYLDAVVSETLRYRPMASGHFSRRTIEPTVVDGITIPTGISVEVSPYAASHSPINFVEPDTFEPERFLANAPEKFSRDDKEASQPFFLGPRACVGKNLAKHMILSTLAGLLWHFDMELVNPNQDWANQKFRTVWHRPGMMVKFTPRT